MGLSPQDFGYEKAAEKGPLTKYVKDTDDGRLVVYDTPAGAVRVNERARTPNVARTSAGFFWRENIDMGLLHETQRADSVEHAHELAQEEVQQLLES